MELKKHLDFRKIAMILYCLFFVAYLLIGLHPADAVHYDIVGQIEIPAIHLESDVASVNITNHKLETPNTIAGSFSWAENKTLIIGHSTAVFEDLKDVKPGEDVFYAGTQYRIVESSVVKKEDIVMEDVLEGAENDTLIIMTCAGKLLDGGDATHRLMVTAVAV